MSQAVSPPPLAAKDGVRSQASLREICGEQCGIGTGCSPVNIIPPVLHTNVYAYFFYEKDRWAMLGDFPKTCFFFLKSGSVV